MERKAQDTDFLVDVEGIGSFTFGKRKMADEIAIQVEFARIVDGVEPTAWLQSVGGWLSVLRVLTVRAPAGWNIDEMDPLDGETYAKLSLVYTTFIEKERSFRRPKNVGSEG